MRIPPFPGIETMNQGGIEHRELSIQILGNWNHRLGQSGSPTTLLALPHLTNSWFRGSNKLCLSTCTTGFRTFWTKYPSCKRKRMCRLWNQYSKKQWYCWWKESCTTWDVNNGISTISTGAGFLPSTVTMALWYIYPRSNQDLPLRWQILHRLGPLNHCPRRIPSDPVQRANLYNMHSMKLNMTFWTPSQHESIPTLQDAMLVSWRVNAYTAENYHGNATISRLQNFVPRRHDHVLS